MNGASHVIGCKRGELSKTDIRFSFFHATVAVGVFRVAQHLPPPFH